MQCKRPLIRAIFRISEFFYFYGCFYFYSYINTLQALCRNVIRIGSPGDGGKEICVDGAYKPKAPCLIYSFG